MTCIVALKNERGVVVGCDSAVASGGFLHSAKADKIFRHNDLILGTSGDAKDGMILRFNLPPELNFRDSGTSPTEFVIKKFLPIVKAALKKYAFVEKKDGVERMGITILLAFDKSIFEIAYDGAVLEAIDFASIGSGREVASGAYEMYKILELDLFQGTIFSIERLVERILSVTEKYIVSVRSPFYILKTWEIDSELELVSDSEQKQDL